MKLYLAHLSKNSELSLQLAKGDNIVGPVLIDKSAKIGNGGLIGPNVVIGPNVRLEDGVRIMDSTVLSDTVVQTHSYVRDSIIGWKCNIGKCFLPKFVLIFCFQANGFASKTAVLSGRMWL